MSMATPPGTKSVSELEELKSILRPSEETQRKIAELKKLLEDRIPVHKAVAMARLGWKNYYKYAPLIYDYISLEPARPKEKMRDIKMRALGTEELAPALEVPAKKISAKNIMDVMRGRKKVDKEEAKPVFENPGREWLGICWELQIKWMYELWRSTL